MHAHRRRHRPAVPRAGGPFRRAEIGLDAFGYNIENRHLVAALEAAAQRLPSLARIADEAASIDHDTDGATVALENGDSVAARLVIGADGRQSLCRAAAGIESDSASYPQTALTFNLRHSRPHHDTSTEFHTASGPFTLVPLPGERSSLVCVVEPSEAEELLALDDAALAEEIERRSHSILGKIDGRTRAVADFRSPVADRAPLRATSRIALVGEAAHLIPPIGAQGLNLGLRDAATIAELVVAAHRSGRDVGRGRACSPATTGCAAPTLTGRTLRDRSAQPLAAVRLPAGAGRARARPLSDRPDRPAAARGDARGRGAARVAAAPDARRGVVTAA